MPLDALQEQLLLTLVEASRRGTREQPTFSYIEPPGGRPQVEHAGLREDLAISRGDIDVLAHGGYLTHRQVIYGSGSFELTPKAYEAYVEIRNRPDREAPRPAEPRREEYVDPTRLEELRVANCDEFDMTRLIRLCEELNITWREGAYHSTAMLVRAILDHVPPIFGVATFAQVVNNYRGSKSFKQTVAGLDSAARNIADSHLHTQIRCNEVLPTPTQVNFSPALDVLLGEIVRLTK